MLYLSDLEQIVDYLRERAGTVDILVGGNEADEVQDLRDATEKELEKVIVQVPTYGVSVDLKPYHATAWTRYDGAGARELVDDVEHFAKTFRSMRGNVVVRNLRTVLPVSIFGAGIGGIIAGLLMPQPTLEILALSSLSSLFIALAIGAQFRRHGVKIVPMNRSEARAVKSEKRFSFWVTAVFSILTLLLTLILS